jgi:hypothetical protein
MASRKSEANLTYSRPSVFSKPELSPEKRVQSQVTFKDLQESTATSTPKKSNTPKLTTKSMSAKDIHETPSDQEKQKAHVITRSLSGKDVTAGVPMASKAISSWLYGSEESVTGADDHHGIKELHKQESKLSVRFHGSLVNMMATKSITEVISQPNAPITPGSPTRSPTRQLSEVSPVTKPMIHSESKASIKVVKDEQALVSPLTKTIESWVNGPSSQSSSAPVSAAESLESLADSQQPSTLLHQNKTSTSTNEEGAATVNSTVSYPASIIPASKTEEKFNDHMGASEDEKMTETTQKAQKKRAGSVKKEMDDASNQSEASENALKKSPSKVSLRTSALIRSASKASVANVKVSSWTLN